MKPAFSACLNRIRGCLLGALAGDCLGQPFERYLKQVRTMQEYEKYMESVTKFVTSCFKGTNEGEYVLRYTDDTALAQALLRSLIECNGFNEKNMAKGFADTFFKDTNRGYGSAVCQVFSKIRSGDYDNVYQPAKEQFQGTGSHGNGGAMRVAPVALFYGNDPATAFKRGAVQNGRILDHISPGFGLLLCSSDPERSSSGKRLIGVVDSTFSLKTRPGGPEGF
ncbi:hypothetical protein M514_05792 [Trichuris suis]|uniref:ADP-ribosylhydrolase ARH3 n=1 Tax=Trichuris suis TaxID=68888 RepID=A0A085NAA5_9BILA|nr:hypothetical protein M514_05792 [Trichuris suis]